MKRFNRTIESGLLEQRAEIADEGSLNPFIETFNEILSYVAKETKTGRPIQPELNKLYKLAQELVNHIEAEFKEELWNPKKPRFPLKWMRDIPAIKKYRICDVMNALGKYEGLYVHPDMCIENNGKKYPLAAFVSDATFYKKILQKFNPPMAEITLKKYLAALCKIHVLEKIETIGQYRKPVYILGYYNDKYDLGKGKNPCVYFLQANLKKELESFKL